MKNIFYLITLFLFTTSLTFGQTTIYSQNFGTGTTLPTGWTSSGTGVSVDNAAPNSDYITPIAASGGSYLKFVDNSSTNAVIVSGINTVGYTNIKVSMGQSSDINWNTFTNVFTVEWSSDGVNWNPAGDFVDFSFSDDSWSFGEAITIGPGSGGVTNLRIRITLPPLDATGGIFRMDDFIVSGASGGAATYYSKSSGNLNELATWGINVDGTGASPISFTSNDQTFRISNNATPTISAAWTVSGTNSKVIVENGINFTIPSGAAYSGIVDISSGATLTINNTTIPTLGIIDPTSTIVFGAATQQILPATTYGNVTITTNPSAVSPHILSGSTIIEGVLNVARGLGLNNQSLTLNGTITGASGFYGSSTSNLTINGAGAFGTIRFAGTRALANLTINRSTAGTVTLGSILTINNQLVLDEGIFIIGGSTLTLSDASISATNGSIRGGTTSNISFTGSSIVTAGTLKMDTSSEANSTLNNLSTNRPLSLGSDLILAGTLTLNSPPVSGNYSFNVGNNTLTLNGPSSLIGANTTFSTSTSSNLIFGPYTGSVTVPSTVINVNDLTINNTNGVSLQGSVTVNGALSLQSGPLRVLSNSLTLKGSVTAVAGTLTSNADGTVNYDQGTNGQTILAANYGNLQFSDFNKVLNAGQTFKIAGVFDPGSAIGHTVLNSSIEYNGTGAQTVSGFNYHNLIVSGSGRTITLSGNIGIAGTFTPNSNVFPVNTSVVTYNGATNQTIATGTSLNYHNLSTSNAGVKRVGNNNLIVTGALTIGTSTTLNSQGFSIFVGGNWVNNGTFTASTGTVTFNGSGQSISGNNSNFYNLSKQGTGTLTLLSAQNLYGTLSVVPFVNVNSSGNLALISDINGTARIDNMTDASIIGNVTVQQYIPARRAFRFLASPVQNATIGMWRNLGDNTPGIGTHITGTGGATNNFDPTPTNSPSAFTYNESLTGTTTGAWTAVTNGNIASLNGHRGFRVLIRGDRTVNLTSNNPPPTITTLSLVGVPYQYAQPVSLSYTAALPEANRGWNLIGNPYASPIDFNLFSDDEKALVGNSFQTWDPTLGVRGAYYYYNNGVSTPTRTIPTVIAANQAFFVKASSAGTLVFRETMKVGSQPTVGFRLAEEENILRIKVSNGAVEDHTLVRFMEEAATGYDAFDSYKFPNEDVNLSTELLSGMRFAINSLPTPQKNLIIPLHLTTTETGSYQLEFSQIASLQNIKSLYLEDKLLNKTVDIMDNPVYAFNIGNDTLSVNRFRLICSAEGKSMEHSNTIQVYPNPVVDAQFNVVIPESVAGEVKVELYNSVGKEVFAQQMISQSLGDHSTIQVKNLSSLSKGIYILNCTTVDRKYVKKLIIQ